MHNSSAVATQQGPVTVSIVVACYDRMGLLERTLKACMAQTGMPVDATWEIVVADNHPRRLATAVVSRLQADSPVALRHIPAGERNIAHARNCGIAAARGSFIAFVDDDEAPDPDWLQAHLGCLNRTGADAGFGPKYPVFAGGAAPEWDPAGRSYTTDFHMPQDAEIHPLRWFPPQARGLGTGNSMMRRATCLAGKTPFDEEFGRCGGEDTLLLLGLAQQGRRFVWCADARVREFNEASRMTFSYMCKRMQRSSRHSAMVRMEISQHRAATRLGIYGVALAQMAVYGSLWLLRRKPADYLQICKALGKLGLGSLDFIPEPPVAPARS